MAEPLAESRRGRREPLQPDGPGTLLIIPRKGKSLLATGVPRLAAEGHTGPTTVNHLESGGTCNKRGFGFGTTGKWGITVL